MNPAVVFWDWSDAVAWAARRAGALGVRQHVTGYQGQLGWRWRVSAR